MQVVEHGETDSSEYEYLVRFMKRSGVNLYQWPEDPDTSWQPRESILCVLDTPTLMNSRGHFTFKSKNIKDIQSLVSKKTIIFG